MSAYRAFRARNAEFEPPLAPKVPKPSKVLPFERPSLGGLDTLGAEDPPNSEFCTTILDADGLPSTPCLTCDGGLFWAPADAAPELGHWRCQACEPRATDLLAHACVVPGAVSPAPPSGPLSPPPVAESVADPDWTDDRSWIALVVAEKRLDARRPVIVRWGVAAGGRIVLDGDATFLEMPPDLPACLALVDLKRLARDVGLTVRMAP